MALVIFGRWNVGGLILGCLAFGAVDSLQQFLQASDSLRQFMVKHVGVAAIPYPLLKMLPYVAALGALAVLTRGRGGRVIWGGRGRRRNREAVFNWTRGFYNGWMVTDRVILSRQVRFGLHENDAGVASVNGFAGQPALLGMAPFLTLTARVGGGIDPATGMVINIKLIDEVLRRRAVPVVREYYYGASGPKARGGGDLLLALRTVLAEQFKPCVLRRLELALSPYLRLSVGEKELDMVELTQRFEFSAAHRLHCTALECGREPEGFCAKSQ